MTFYRPVGLPRDSVAELTHMLDRYGVDTTIAAMRWRTRLESGEEPPKPVLNRRRHRPAGTKAQPKKSQDPLRNALEEMLG